jgi:hypothetical protein
MAFRYFTVEFTIEVHDNIIRDRVALWALEMVA